MGRTIQNNSTFRTDLPNHYTPITLTVAEVGFFYP
jgi:hypothetical protein